MLLPDNVHPEHSIYYNGSIVLAELNEESKLQIMDLYQRVKERNGMSFPIFILSLDWLYLIDVAQINSEGVVELCS